jgi:ABC-type uncharacterized transport system permease subunit
MQSAKANHWLIWPSDFFIFCRVKAAPRPAAGRTPPLVFAAGGELVVEKAGVLNLGIEA